MIVVSPGAVATPIWDKAGEIDVTPYRETEYATALARFLAYVMDTGPKGDPPKGDPPERIARVIHEVLTAPRPKTRYAPVHGKFMNWILPALLPKRYVDRKIGRALGLLK